jgi:hypothetical protein
VNGEDEVQSLADALNERLEAQNIRCAACPGGQVKGRRTTFPCLTCATLRRLEFKAVFFVGVDRLAKVQQELFEKYLYVGTTRAATYLGLTCSGPQLLTRLLPLAQVFGESWP